MRDKPCPVAVDEDAQREEGSTENTFGRFDVGLLAPCAHGHGMSRQTKGCRRSQQNNACVAGTGAGTGKEQRQHVAMRVQCSASNAHGTRAPALAPATRHSLQIKPHATKQTPSNRLAKEVSKRRHPRQMGR